MIETPRICVPSSTSAARTRTRSRCSRIRRAVAAQQSGIFAQEIVPVAVPQRRGDALIVDTDEHPRATRASSPSRSCARSAATSTPAPPSPPATPAARTTVPQSQSSRHRRRRKLSGFVRSRASRAGRSPVSRPGRWASGRSPPPRRPSRGSACRSPTWASSSLNEAFAAQALAVIRTWGLEPDDARLTPTAPASRWVPSAPTGARILATLLREMDRREARYGLENMCIGGGQGLAAVFERIA